MEPAGEQTEFTVALENFTGPFDLLLQLIHRRQLDITEVALSEVTVEFIQYVKQLGESTDLEETTSFLVIAATLLDLKTARLLPQGEVEDPEDLLLLEAKDLLFARLLQYRAFALMSQQFNERLLQQSQLHARPGGMESKFAQLLPEPEIGVSSTQLAQIAALALTVKDIPQVPLEHLHLPQVSIAEQAELVMEKLRQVHSLDFTELIARATKPEIIARFLVLLELFRSQLIELSQPGPFSKLQITWVANQSDDLEPSSAAVEIDEFEGTTK